MARSFVQKKEAWQDVVRHADEVEAQKMRHVIFANSVTGARLSQSGHLCLPSKYQFKQCHAYGKWRLATAVGTARLFLIVLTCYIAFRYA